jgi:hypothetical protein
MDSNLRSRRERRSRWGARVSIADREDHRAVLLPSAGSRGSALPRSQVFVSPNAAAST